MIGVALFKIWGSHFTEKKNRNRHGEDLFAFANLFQKESDIENLRSDHQIAFITTQNVCWNI